ncbi:hypothetical protein PoB_007369700 [Plakobranchus ocellatus]|uniref:Uncharacterized protein n=1 Tax=Plakobranchus ocellatus TaxID=259542 RepID=A0AAV4DSA1_9GAST|nr:hypothetical protein PoB_007369700 [Plakobranchus ocellatus]
MCSSVAPTRKLDKGLKALDHFVVYTVGSDDLFGRAVDYQIRGPGYESQSGPNQFIIAPPCPPSTKWPGLGLDWAWTLPPRVLGPPMDSRAGGAYHSGLSHSWSEALTLEYH